MDFLFDELGFSRLSGRWICAGAPFFQPSGNNFGNKLGCGWIFSGSQYRFFRIFRRGTFANFHETALSRIFWTRKKFLVFGVLVMMGALFLSRTRLSLHLRDVGVGLAPHVQDAADFIIDHQLSGPVFNNFDSGGYVIWNFWPEQKPFVDNRPEAYLASFFSETYIPMQLEGEVWQKELAERNFKLIFFSLSENTPWGQRFLVDRIQDPAWAPVYVDSYALIFVRRTPEHAEVIKRYEIPRDHFGVTSF